MKVWAGVFLVPAPHPPIFQRRVIRAGALRPEPVHWYWLIKPSCSVLERREGSLHNEREAKLAVSFDPEGIKTVLLMEVERSGLPVSLSVWWTAGKRYTAFCRGVWTWVLSLHTGDFSHYMLNWWVCSYNTLIIGIIHFVMFVCLFPLFLSQYAPLIDMGCAHAACLPVCLSFPSRIVSVFAAITCFLCVGEQLSL